MAEWLRRLTRNQFPSGSVGSNPTDCENILILLSPEAGIGGPMQHADLIQHRWFSGRMLACHAGGPGSIPGRCSNFFSLSHPAYIIFCFPSPARAGSGGNRTKRMQGQQLQRYKKEKVYFASSGNRTRAARVAGEHSTTEPTMLHLKAHRNT